MFVRLALVLSLVFPGTTFAGDPVFPSHVVENSWDHLADQMMKDFVALATTPYERSTIQTERMENGDRMITIGAEAPGRGIQIRVKFGLEGLPVQMVSAGGILDLSGSWKEVREKLRASREMYQTLRADHQPTFEEYARAEMKLENVILPVKNAVAGFLKNTLENVAAIDKQLANPDPFDALRARARKADSRFTKIVLGIGGALAAVGIYGMVRSMLDLHFPMLSHGFAPTFAGLMMAAIWFTNQIPLVLGGDETLLESMIITRGAERLDQQEALKREQIRMRAEQIQALARANSPTYHRVGGIGFRNHYGSITDVQAEAWVLPAFPDRASPEGAASVVKKAGGEGEEGMAPFKEFDALVANAPLEYGSVRTVSGVGNQARNIMFAVLENGGKTYRQENHALARRLDYTLVKNAYLWAFREAKVRGLHTVASILLGFGMGGTLDPVTSQHAMFAAALEFGEMNPDYKLEVTTAIYRMPYVWESLEERLVEASKGQFQPVKELVASNHELCGLMLKVKALQEDNVNK